MEDVVLLVLEGLLLTDASYTQLRFHFTVWNQFLLSGSSLVLHQKQFVKNLVHVCSVP